MIIAPTSAITNQLHIFPPCLTIMIFILVTIERIVSYVIYALKLSLPSRVKSEGY